MHGAQVCRPSLSAPVAARSVAACAPRCAGHHDSMDGRRGGGLGGAAGQEGRDVAEAQLGQGRPRRQCFSQPRVPSALQGCAGARLLSHRCAMGTSCSALPQVLSQCLDLH